MSGISVELTRRWARLRESPKAHSSPGDTSAENDQPESATDLTATDPSMTTDDEWIDLSDEKLKDQAILELHDWTDLGSGTEENGAAETEGRLAACEQTATDEGESLKAQHDHFRQKITQQSQAIPIIPRSAVEIALDSILSRHPKVRDVELDVREDASSWKLRYTRFEPSLECVWQETSPFMWG